MTECSRWVFHLVGDVHQPLHTVALFTTQFPPPEGIRIKLST